jgi:RNA polymerase sigma-70 factor, ECF subfamily
VIETAPAGDEPDEMITAAAPLAPSDGVRVSGRARDDGRLRGLIDDHADFVFRTLRRLGLPSDAADDASQRVFITLSMRLCDVRPGAEQAFLFKTAVYLASRARRGVARRREDLTDDPGADLADPSPTAEELVDKMQARALLDRALDGMDDDVRAIFILFELEGKSTAEIAEMLDAKAGTVASRLRRGREHFEAFIKRLQARDRSRTP